MRHFKFYNKQDIYSFVKTRRYETRLGERIHLPKGSDWPELLSESAAKYVLFGIPEDIGVKANFGVGGADTNWYPFLHAFLNIQSNDFCSGEDVMLLGHFDFGDLKYLIENNAFNEEEKIDAYRHAVNTIDDETEQLVKQITAAGKIPLVIGGGHNNAYPIIKGSAKGLLKGERIPIAQINAINADAHADYRAMEGRHSGNGFRYAEHDGYLGKYSVVGLHEGYISQSVLMDVANNPFMQFTSYEDIFLRERKTWTGAVEQAVAFTEDNYCGIELDLDCIENILSSACTPAGISVLHARQFLRVTAQRSRIAYLHLCEGASHLADGRKCETTGKLLSTLVADFIKAVNEQ